ncbi:MAG: T9SS type A sorting domain-containing protein [Bacteroidales bacterium]|nr:T9SS type A sorting domain-containing protein [Bacteroidales bacterium]
MKFRAFILVSILTLTGIQALANDNSLRIYPNPVVDETISIESEQEFQKIEILSIVGHVVQSEEPEPSNSVRLKVNLQPGVYLIRITFSDKTMNTKRIRVN